MIVVVGGAGYIGSVCVEDLVKEGFPVVVVDDLSLGNREAVPDEVPFYEGDMADPELIREVSREHDVSVVMHFAALAKVGESMEQPVKYWDSNLRKSISMIETWLDHGVDRFVLSSTAATYGEPEEIPIPDDHPTEPINPYGRTKRALEWYLEDRVRCDDLRFASLRYFNAAGSGDEVGEDHDPETHLIPLLLETAAGQRDEFYIFGDDYPTRDGTCLRDFVHVKDLARAHRRAVDYLEEQDQLVVNLGTSNGATVREVVETVREVTGRDFSVSVDDRRPGDPARLVADYQGAKQELGWEPEHDLEQIIRDAWEWKQQHPTGYN